MGHGAGSAADVVVPFLTATAASDTPPAPTRQTFGRGYVKNDEKTRQSSLLFVAL